MIRVLVLLLMHMIVIITLAMSTKIPHVNDFTYLQYFYCRQKDFEPIRCLFECILVAPASSALVERVLFLKVG